MKWKIIRSYQMKDDAQTARKEWTARGKETRVVFNPKTKRYVLMVGA